MIELRLRVETGDGHAHDVEARLTPEHRIGELAAALARHLDLDTPGGHGPTLRGVRQDRTLGTDVLVGDSGLVSGDEVQLGLHGVGDRTRPQLEPGQLVLETISGPASGRTHALAAGRSTVGRGTHCTLALDDPTVSSAHVHLDLRLDGDGDGDGDEVTATPLPEVTNPVVVDGRAIVEPTPLREGSVLELGSSALVLRRHVRELGASRDRLGNIPFNRTPYRHPELEPVEVRGPGRPPAPYEPRPLMVLAMLAPAVAGVAFALILNNPIFLLFALLSPLSMLGSWWSDRRRGGSTHRQQVATFEARFADFEQRYDQALADERARRFQAAPDLAELARRAEHRTPELWGRRRDAAGFLTIRLGLGPAPALTTSRPPDGVEDDPDDRVGDAIAARRLLPSVPITVDLDTQGVLAIVGDTDEVETAAASAVVQAAVLHSPDELVICTALHPRRTLTGWDKWLPHTRSVVSPLAGAHVATGAAAADDLLQRLSEVIAARAAAPRAERERVTGPRVLLVLDELADADAVLVAQVLEAGPAVGVVAVWLGTSRQLVPRHAAAVLECPPLASGRRATLWTTDTSTPDPELTPDRLSLAAAPRIARALAPVRDASAASATASIPRVSPLLEAIGAPDLDRDGVLQRWKRTGEDGLAAPVGMGADGPFVLDLVEHGPHTLIAGTSGAGKSELLQSMIASLVVHHPPDRLNLLFIDYKGGASSDVFQPLPHTVGSVTNLGAELAMRALTSLRAELDHRMRVLEGRAKDLAEMRTRFPDEAPASLVIVVDEFATLVKEIPDFVAGMVDIAQRGRSLGIHLVLATQRPAGAVNDNILANTNLRIALRVLDPQDSTSILGSAEAASIPAPLRGRALAKLGAGGLREFQAAYAGAPHARPTGNAVPIVVDSFPADGRTTVHPEPVRIDDGPARTHLDVVVDAVLEASAAAGHERGRRPWLEELPRSLALAEVLDGSWGELGDRVPGRDVVLGVVDLPAAQRQAPRLLDLEDAGGVLVFGTGGSGRTTTLRTLIGSAIAGAGADEVEVFVLDYAGRGLETLRTLPHVAAVAAADDLEQTTRMLMHLRAEVERRQTLLATHRAEDLTTLHEVAPEQRLPRMLLVVDGYEAFDRTFERGSLYLWAELLMETVLAGRSVGIHLLATADRRIGVPAGIANAVGGRIVLRTVDRDGLLDLGIPADVAADAQLGDGRALLPGGVSLQIPVVGGEVAARAQADALAALAREGAALRATDGAAVSARARLPQLPEVVPADELPAPTAPLEVVLGLADLDDAPATATLTRSHLTVVGPPESGRTTTLIRAARCLAATGQPVWVVAPPGSAALDLVDDARRAVPAEEHAPLLEAVRAAADAERDVVQVLVIDRGERLADVAGMGMDALLDHERVRVLVGFDGATMTSYSAAPWQTACKRARALLLLQPDDLGDLGAITPVTPRLRPGQDFPPGRGVLISGRRWQLIQVAVDATARTDPGDAVDPAT